MNRIIIVALFVLNVLQVSAQRKPINDVSPDPSGVKAISGDWFINGKKNFSTSIKNQEQTNTCWSFSTTSLVESEAYKNKLGVLDLSEMYTVRKIYLDKATNYLLRQGKAQFSEGGLGHDVIHAIATYGAMTQSAYSGLTNGQQTYQHTLMFLDLKRYVDSTLKSRKPSTVQDWKPGFERILDHYMGALPNQFLYNNVKYTPNEFASKFLKFNESDYVNITSFQHHPYYKPFIIEVPDNFSNGAYYNLPLEEMIRVTENALQNGHTVLWDADVSNNGFNGKIGMGMLLAPSEKLVEHMDPDFKEAAWNADIRQQLFENFTTQDDHLMHIVGIEKTKQGKTFFIVKNSWGTDGEYFGYVHVSEAYFAINTIGLVLPKAAINLPLLQKLKLDK
jgi:bleomycin hydrolase